MRIEPRIYYTSTPLLNSSKNIHIHIYIHPLIHTHTCRYVKFPRVSMYKNRIFIIAQKPSNVFENSANDNSRNKGRVFSRKTKF